MSPFGKPDEPAAGMLLPGISSGGPAQPAAQDTSPVRAYKHAYVDLTSLEDDAASTTEPCPICLSSISISSAISSSSSDEDHSMTLNCQHSFHSACLAQHLTLCNPLADGESHISCPKCKADQVFARKDLVNTAPAATANIGLIAQYDIAQLVHTGHLTAEKELCLSRQLTRAAMQATAGTNDTIYSCISCNALLLLQPGADCSSPLANTATCLLCHSRQCCSCGVEWSTEHADISCVVFKARQQQATADPKTKEVLAKSLPCPGCGHGIVKVGGCNKVKCAKCKTMMCWACGQQLPQGGAAYQHFGKDGEGLCRKYAAPRPSWVPEGIDYKPEREQKKSGNAQQPAAARVKRGRQQPQAPEVTADKESQRKRRRPAAAAESDDEWVPKRKRH